MTYYAVRRCLLRYTLAALWAVCASVSHAVASDGIVVSDSIVAPDSTVVSDSIAASARLGGRATVNVSGKDAYSLPSANLSPLRRLDFSVGNSFFRNPWVIAPSSTEARDGLGPLFNTNACQNCHIKDGRGHPVSDTSDNAVSMLVRLSIPATTVADHALAKQLGVVPEPTYGTQFQDMAIPGIEPEVKIRLRWTTRQVSLTGGETVELRQPRLILSAWGYGPVHPDTQYSVRVAPPMIGLGLLEAIPLTRMLQLADPDDADNDGISGRINQVWDGRQQAAVAGRFGWKAGQPSLDQQNLAAFAGDMGLTSTLMEQDECSRAQMNCLSAMSGGIPEVSDDIRARVLFYSRQLAVPAQRNVTSPDVQAGRAIFQRAGCVACHVPSHQTRADAAEPELAEQHIWPYTDLLLHDMGPGLADGRPEFEASGSEWRTPPLWGIGLTQTVNPRAGFLHDGRARSLLEAIVWHGGEAQGSRDAVTQLSISERNALLAFLESL